MIYIFPVLSRFENTVKNTIRNSFLMSILNLPKTILLVIINLVPAVVLLVTLQAMPIVILFGFSVPAYVASMLFVKIFKRFEPCLLYTSAHVVAVEGIGEGILQ